MERPSRLASIWRSNSTSWVKADLFFHKALSEFFKDRLKINILGSTKRNITPPQTKKERKSRNFQTFGEELFSSRNDGKNEPNVILKYKIFLFGCHFFKFPQTNILFFSQTNLFFSPNKPIFFPKTNHFCQLHWISLKERRLCADCTSNIELSYNSQRNIFVWDWSFFLSAKWVSLLCGT